MTTTKKASALGKGKTMEFINDTLGVWMDKMAEQNGDCEAVVFDDTIVVNKGSEKEYSYRLTYRKNYRDFNADCDRYAKAFLALGIEKGDHVAIWATNYPQWLLTLFACAKIGAVLVTVNTAYKIHDAEYLLRQSDTKMLVMTDSFKDVSYVDIIGQLCSLENQSPDDREIKSKRLPCLKKVITLDEKVHGSMYNWKEIAAFADKISDEEYARAREGISVHDVVNMQYTSGTTGFPKGVMLTHYNIINNGKTIGDCMKFTNKDRLCVTVPLFHCFGLVLATMASITHGTTIVLVNYYSPIKVLNTLQREKCTAVHGVPTMFIAMLEHPKFQEVRGDGFSLRTGIMAGSPCPIKTMRQVIDEMGMKEITITYGQTEASPGCTQTTTDDPIEKRVNTVGKHFPGVETKIINPETGETLGVNRIGEFCARGYNIMKGYYKMPEATAQAIDKDGWLHTGDLACCDEDGYYKITGRIKDMIIRGGENIYPKEIEDFIYTHPDVKDVQVIGVPSVAYGEEICACVIPKEGCSVTEEDIKTFVSTNLAKYKTPSYVVFLDSFPMNAAGKILKYRLRSDMTEKLGLTEAGKIETA